MELTDIGVDGLDLRIGRQIITWGTADRFHPTANLNPLDVHDALKFGAQVANEMIALRWHPDASLGDEDDPWLTELGLEIVFVPFFKPAQLPQSAGLAFTDEQEFTRRADSEALQPLLDLQRTLTQAGTVFNYHPLVELPGREIANSMAGARLQWKLLGVDMSASYFRGFDDFPRAEHVDAELDGTLEETFIKLTYPRMQVLGVDAATSLDFLDGLGLWGEVAVVFHDDLYRVVDTHGQIETIVEKEHAKGQFVKATVGTDYTPLPWWYLNVQYLHGFVDEFGAAKLGDYLVPGMDFKLFRDTLLLRFFSIIDLQDRSFVLFPQVVATPWNGGEVSVGAFLFMGPDDTKFGSDVAGRSTVFVKGKASF